MKNISIKVMEKICKLLLLLPMRTSRTSWPWDLIQKRLLSALTLDIWVICTLTSVASKGISTSPLSKLYSVFNFLTAVARHHILLFKLLLVYLAVSLTYLAIRIYLAWFPVVLIKILISEWPEMSVLNWKLLNLLDSIINFSHLYKGSMVKCQDPFLNLASSWLTSLNKLKTRSRNMLSVEEKLPRKSKSNLELIWLSIFHISTWDFSWKTRNNLNKLVRNTGQARCWLEN